MNPSQSLTPFHTSILRIPLSTLLYSGSLFLFVQTPGVSQTQDISTTTHFHIEEFESVVTIGNEETITKEGVQETKKNKDYSLNINKSRVKRDEKRELEKQVDQGDEYLQIEKNERKQ